MRECLTWKSLGTTEFYSSQTPWLVFSLFSSELSVFFPFIALLWVRKITEFMSFVFMVLLLQCFLQYRPIPHMAAQTHICTFSVSVHLQTKIFVIFQEIYYIRRNALRCIISFAATFRLFVWFYNDLLFATDAVEGLWHKTLDWPGLKFDHKGLRRVREIHSDNFCSLPPC